MYVPNDLYTDKNFLPIALRYNATFLSEDKNEQTDKIIHNRLGKLP